MRETVVSSSVLIITVTFLRYILKGKISLRLQYGLWFLVLLRLLAPFSLPDSRISVINAMDAVLVRPPILEGPKSDQGDLGALFSEGPVMEEAASAFNWGRCAMWLRCGGVGVVGVFFIASNLVFFKRLSRSRTRRFIDGFNLPLYEVKNLPSPCLFGVFRPSVYITEEAFEDEKNLGFVLSHELTHYRHGDHIWSFFRCLCLSVHWYNPLVWLAASLSRQDAESACDESVIKKIGEKSRAEYGRVLLDITCGRRRRGDLMSLATTMADSKKTIKKRINLIAKGPKMAASTLVGVLVFTAILAGCTFTGAKKPVDYPEGEWRSVFTDCLNKKEGWFVGSKGVALGTSYNYVYLTRDGGETWEETGNVNGQWSRVLTAAAFSDLKKGFLCFRYDIENLGPIYRTLDGGETWERYIVPEFLVLAQDGVGEVRKIEFAGEKEGSLTFYFRPIGGDLGAVQKFLTYDGGETWVIDGEPQRLADDLFNLSTGNIDDYLPKLLSGESVSDYEILPCLTNFTRQTWLELNDRYKGQMWFNVLWESLNDASLAADTKGQELRNYYIGKAYLTSDGAYSEGLSDIVMKQWEYSPSLYSASLEKFFSPDESLNLRRCITFGANFWRDDLFCLHSPQLNGYLCLFSYPIDFPFGHDLAETAKETTSAESFGLVTTVESAGLQIAYLDNGGGVFKVIRIRAKDPGYGSLGCSVGDSEESLMGRGIKNLKRRDSLSYDDEAWFGKGYEKIYAYTPSDGTKSVVFIIKGGLVTGIEVVDGLDGPMY